jgi:hydrogenase expression/formation protein HypD
LALEQGVIALHLRRLPARAGLRQPVADEGQGAWRRHPHGLFSADALTLAQKNPDKQVVFFAIGFETTTPPTAVAIKQAAALGLKNFPCSAATC